MQYNRINITGDFYFPNRCETNFIKENIDPNISNLFKESDLNIWNLESPFNEEKNKKKILKKGTHIKNHLSSVNVLKHLNIHLLTLANNHIKDYGNAGIENTLEYSKENNLDTIGAGLNIKDARKIYYKKLKSLTIGIINATENEWSIADNESAGANPIDIINISEDIKRAKELADLVIVILHGGHERYSLPSPRIVKTYRFLVDQGANAVVAHHPHCYSGYEIYKNSPIFYSLGNFMFPKNNAVETWYTGFVLELLVDKSLNIQFKLHPYKQCKSSINIEMMNDVDRLNFFENIKNFNEIIDTPEKLEKYWDNYIDSIKSYNLNIFSLKNIFPNRLIRSLIRKIGMDDIFLPEYHLKTVLNYLRCESHRDTSIQCLLSEIKKHEQRSYRS